MRWTKALKSLAKINKGKKKKNSEKNKQNKNKSKKSNFIDKNTPKLIYYLCFCYCYVSPEWYYYLIFSFLSFLFPLPSTLLTITQSIPHFFFYSFTPFLFPHNNSFINTFTHSLISGTSARVIQWLLWFLLSFMTLQLGCNQAATRLQPGCLISTYFIWHMLFRLWARNEESVREKTVMKVESKK